MFESDPITEIVREYGGMETVGGAVLTNYPTMSSRYGDFARDNQQQQTSAGYSQRRNTHENDCCFCLCFWFMHVLFYHDLNNHFSFFLQNVSSKRIIMHHRLLILVTVVVVEWLKDIEIHLNHGKVLLVGLLVIQ
jgi:hypothetical protein